MSKEINVIRCSQPYFIGCVAHCGIEELELIAQKDGVHQFVIDNRCLKQVIEVDAIAGQPFELDLSCLPVNKEVSFYIIDPDGSQFFDDIEITSCDPCNVEEPEVFCYSHFYLQTVVTIITEPKDEEIIEAGINLPICDF